MATRNKPVQQQADLNCIPTPTNMEKLLLQDFMALLNKEPDSATLVKSADGKANSLSISAVETTLDELFFGQWDLVDVTTQQVFNEITGIGTLVCVHPITGREIKRTGFASIVITQDAGAAVTDFNHTKKKNALDLAFPKLRSEILKNAAQSLGKVFGRDLNRKVADTYTPMVKVLTEQTLEQVIGLIEQGKADKDEAVRKMQTVYSMTDEQLTRLVNIPTTKQLQA